MDVQSNEVVPGNIVLLKAGGKIPADLRLYCGTSHKACLKVIQNL